MNYQRMLDSLDQELAYVNRAFTLLSNANAGKMISSEPRHQHHVVPVDARIERLVKNGASLRAEHRKEMLNELREERALLLRAMAAIQKLANRK